MSASDPRQAFRFCPSCNEEVYTYAVQTDLGPEIRCSACGLPLATAATLGPQQLESVLVADDSRVYRTLLRDVLLERKLAATVEVCASGAELLARAATRFQEHLPVKLVILDVMMTPLNGPATGMALRALEKGLGVSPPAPILFVSGSALEETMKTLLGKCAPALFLHKGADKGPAALGQRLEQVMATLLKGGPKGGRTR
jgi:CheY-like chemotaxis protein